VATSEKNTDAVEQKRGREQLRHGERGNGMGSRKGGKILTQANIADSKTREDENKMVPGADMGLDQTQVISGRGKKGNLQEPADLGAGREIEGKRVGLGRS